MWTRVSDSQRETIGAKCMLPVTRRSNSARLTTDRRASPRGCPPPECGTPRDNLPRRNSSVYAGVVGIGLVQG